MSSDRSDSPTVEELITEYESILDCSPATPWRGCAEPSVSNLEHFDGHREAVELVLDALFAKVRHLASEHQQLNIKLQAASVFIRDVIEALGKQQPPLDAVVDLNALALEVVGHIEELKVQSALTPPPSGEASK